MSKPHLCYSAFLYGLDYKSSDTSSTIIDELLPLMQQERDLWQKEQHETKPCRLSMAQTTSRLKAANSEYVGFAPASSVTTFTAQAESESDDRNFMFLSNVGQKSSHPRISCDTVYEATDDRLAECHNRSTRDAGLVTHQPKGLGPLSDLKSESQPFRSETFLGSHGTEKDGIPKVGIQSINDDMKLMTSSNQEVVSTFGRARLPTIEQASVSSSEELAALPAHTDMVSEKVLVDVSREELADVQVSYDNPAKPDAAVPRRPSNIHPQFDSPCLSVSQESSSIHSDDNTRIATVMLQNVFCNTSDEDTNLNTSDALAVAPGVTDRSLQPSREKPLLSSSSFYSATSSLSLESWCSSVNDSINESFQVYQRTPSFSDNKKRFPGTASQHSKIKVVTDSEVQVLVAESTNGSSLPSEPARAKNVISTCSNETLSLDFKTPAERLLIAKKQEAVRVAWKCIDTLLVCPERFAHTQENGSATLDSTTLFGKYYPEHFARAMKGLCKRLLAKSEYGPIECSGCWEKWYYAHIWDKSHWQNSNGFMYRCEHTCPNPGPDFPCFCYLPASPFEKQDQNKRSFRERYEGFLPCTRLQLPDGSFSATKRSTKCPKITKSLSYSSSYPLEVTSRIETSQAPVRKSSSKSNKSSKSVPPGSSSSSNLKKKRTRNTRSFVSPSFKD